MRTKATIMREAVVEFAHHGFGGGRVDRIVSRAGVSQQMVYYYYGDKRGLYDAVVRHAYESIHAAEAVTDDGHADCMTEVAGIVAMIWHAYRENPDLLSILNAHDALSTPAEHLEAAMPSGPSGASPCVSRIAALLRRGAEQGMFRPSVDPLFVYVSIHALCMSYLARRRVLSAMFGRDLDSDAALTVWRDHVEGAVLAMVTACPPDGSERRESTG